MIYAEKLTFGFGSTPLFQDISFDPATAARDLEAQLAAVMHQ